MEELIDELLLARQAILDSIPWPPGATDAQKEEIVAKYAICLIEMIENLKYEESSAKRDADHHDSRMGAYQREMINRGNPRAGKGRTRRNPMS